MLYPGLPSHPQYALAQKQQHGPGAMITFYVKGDLGNARKFLESLKVFILAESLGAGAFFLHVWGVCMCLTQAGEVIVGRVVRLFDWLVRPANIISPPHIHTQWRASPSRRPS